jgi:hypothetical protein
MSESTPTDATTSRRERSRFIRTVYDINESELTPEQTHAWKIMTRDCPNIRCCDVVWLDRSSNGFLVTIRSLFCKHANVHRVDDIAQVRGLVEDLPFYEVKLYHRCEYFRSECSARANQDMMYRKMMAFITSFSITMCATFIVAYKISISW